MCLNGPIVENEVAKYVRGNARRKHKNNSANQCHNECNGVKLTQPSASHERDPQHKTYLYLLHAQVMQRTSDNKQSGHVNAWRAY